MALDGQADLYATAVLFTFLSFSMSSLNSALIAHFPLPLTIITVQMGFTTAGVGCSPSSLNYGSLDDLRRWGLSAPFLFVGMVSTSVLAKQRSSAGLVTLCRNITPVISMLIEGHFREPFIVTRRTILSLAVVVMGVLFHVAGDLGGSLVAAMASAAFALADRVVQRHLIANIPVELSIPGMVLLNNLVGFLPSALLTLLFEEQLWHSRLRAFGTQSILLVGSCLNALAVSYLGMRLQHHVTATTFLVLSNQSSLFLTLVGAWVMGDVLSVRSAVGCIIAFAGGLLYLGAQKRVSKAPVESHKQGAHYSTVEQVAE